MKIGQHSTHPAADAFRMMNPDEFENLCASIEKMGLRDPIIIDGEERIVDGRNRYRACLKVGFEPKFKTTRLVDEALIELIASTNKDRKHMTAGELAAAGAALVPQYARLARERQRTSVDGGERLLSGDNKETANDAAAAVVGSSPASVARALRIQAADKEAFKELKSGGISIAQATKQAGIVSKPRERAFDARARVQEIVAALTLAEGKIRAYNHDLKKNDVEETYFDHIASCLETLDDAWNLL